MASGTHEIRTVSFMHWKKKLINSVHLSPAISNSLLDKLITTAMLLSPIFRYAGYDLR